MSDTGVYRTTDGGSHWSNTLISRFPTPPARAPSDPNTVYVSVGSALLQSADGGATWAVRGGTYSPGFGTFLALALAVHPANPATIYAGSSALGLHRSVDGGAHWQFLPGLGAYGSTVRSLLIDRSNPDVLYAGVDGNGVFKSIDGAGSWSSVSIGLPAGVNYTLAMDPSNPSVLYAVGNNCLYRTTNAAVDWNISWCGISPVRGFSAAPSNPVVLYAATDKDLWRSDNSGSTWNPAGSGPPGISISTIAVHPSDASVVYAGAAATRDAFVTKLNAAGTSYLYSTFLGGSQSPSSAVGIAVDGSGDAYVTGYTYSSSFPTTAGSFSRFAHSGGAFVAKISNATASCNYDVTPASQFFYEEGGTAGFSMVSPSGCSWSSIPSDGWIGVTAGNSGTGVGGVSIVAGPNSGAARNGQLTVGGQTIAITQAAAGCSYSLDRSSLSVLSQGGSYDIAVTAGAGCGWVVRSDYGWIHPTSTGGTGSGTATLSVAPHTYLNSRTVTVDIGEQSLQVTQAGTCVFTLSTHSAAVDWTGGEGSVDVTCSSPLCIWSASSGTNWLTHTFLYGNGNRTVDYAVAPNTTGRRRSHTLTIAGLSYTVTQAAGPQKAGVYSAGQWKLDADGNGVFDPGVDKSFNWGYPGTTRVQGDWNGDGKQKAGFYIDGLWYLDYNGDGVWDGGATDKVYGFGMAGAQPVVGDWNGDGADKIGIYINGFWFLDVNGNGVWDGEPTDKMIIWGFAGSTPVIGDWNGDGRKKVGLFYSGLWYLDYNGDGVWDGGTTDKVYGFGMSGVEPMVGDWNGDGKEEIGIYIDGFWFLDLNGNGLWDGETTDRMTILGWAGTTPVVGDWNGDGKTKVGTFINGYWYLDYDGSGVWDGGSADKEYVFGQAGDMPVVGRW